MTFFSSKNIHTHFFKFQNQKMINNFLSHHFRVANAKNNTHASEGTPRSTFSWGMFCERVVHVINVLPGIESSGNLKTQSGVEEK